MRASSSSSISIISSAAALLLACCRSVDSFSALSNRHQLVIQAANPRFQSAIFAQGNDDSSNQEDINSSVHPTSETTTSACNNNKDKSVINRRDALRAALATTASSTLLTTLDPTNANAATNALFSSSGFYNPFAPDYAQSTNGGKYIPAKRCTAYLVDATIPPSLIPYRASREAAILKNLGMGYGTPKAPYIEDGINLNNFMNKAVFGTIDAVNQVLGEKTQGKSGENYQSYIFFGANFDDTFTASSSANGEGGGGDAQLAVGLLEDISKPKERDGNTAIGLTFCPQSCQELFDQYVNGGGESALLEGLRGKGVDEQLTQAHLPILRFAKKKRFALLALAPEVKDLETVRKGGLQSLDPEKRERYVIDPQGFIALTQDPKFKLYSDKSLFKDFVPSSNDAAAAKAEEGNYFAEKILTHEACATCITKWAASRPDSLVVTIAPISDVRFMGGINGRVPRISQFLNKDSLVDDDAETTILLNPNAKETLSESKFLRLEIGTSPDNWAYQTKVADYLWFSSMPKVNMLPRMMNEQ